MHSETLVQDFGAVNKRSSVDQEETFLRAVHIERAVVIECEIKRISRPVNVFVDPDVSGINFGSKTRGI